MKATRARSPARLGGKLAGLAVFMAAAAVSPDVDAQQWQPQGFVELATGVAGGGPQAKLVRRARTTLRLGHELRVDERPRDAISVSILAEMEPRAAVGLDAHYVRAITPRLFAGAGGVAFISPETLYGASVMLDYHVPLGRVVHFVVGPSFQVFVLGSDLPEGNPIWQGLLRGGFHVAL